MKARITLRLDRDLLEATKEKASAEKISLNNYIEYLLYREVGDIPNEETISSIEEARNNKNLKSIEDLDEFLNEL